jgi:hypothetical protein
MILGEMLMVDWNFGPPYTEGKPVYISSHEEIESLMADRVKNNPHEFWILYYTPLGAHGFLMSRPMPTDMGVSIMKSLKCDDAYINLCARRGWYNCRTVPKERLGDYIARFWTTYGKQSMHPVMEATLRKHDSHLAPENRYFI